MRGMNEQALDREKVLSIIGNHDKEIRSFGVRKLGLFGSFARGEERVVSDLDFVVQFEHASFDSYMDLKYFLEELFGMPVDLVLSDSIKPRLRPYILQETLYAQGF